MAKEKEEIVERCPALHPAIQLQNHCIKLVFVMLLCKYISWKMQSKSNWEKPVACQEMPKENANLIQIILPSSSGGQ